MSRQIVIVTGINARGEQYDTTMVQIVIEKATQLFGGVSATFVNGSWKNDAGVTITEKSLRLEVFTTSDDFRQRAFNLAQFCKDFYAQESVLLTITEVDEIRFV